MINGDGEKYRREGLAMLRKSITIRTGKTPNPFCLFIDYPYFVYTTAFSRRSALSKTRENIAFPCCYR